MKRLYLVGDGISGLTFRCLPGAGAASLYAPRYISEISPTSLRGKLGTQNQVASWAEQDTAPHSKAETPEGLRLMLPLFASLVSDLGLK
jgi:Sugar (and other) transporter